MSKTLLHIFYEDDLKSVQTEELAIRLIKDVKAMGQVSAFNLTKFILNKEVVIQSVLEYDR